MHVIAAKTIKEFSRRHEDAAGWLADWIVTVEAAEWGSIADVRRVYPHADAVNVASGRSVIVFNVRGNRYRLITAIHFNRGKVYTLKFLSHAEYDRNQWKRQL
jgi:mRNA interferase HigB